jgi:hypothetical protein
VCGIAIALAAPRPADAQSPAQPAKSAAEILYEEAWTAMDAGDHATACAKFTASYQVSHATGPLQGLARCEEGRGHPARALEHWRELTRRLPESSPTRAEAQAQVARLQARVGRLTLRLSSGAPASTRVELDDVQVTPDGSERPVDPDVPHRVRTSAEGHRDRIDQIVVAAGAATSLAVAPLPLTAEEAPATERDGRGRTLRIAGFVAAGIGVASGAVAAITGAMMLDASSDVDDACAERACVDPAAAAEAAEAKERGEALAVPNAIAFVGAAVGIGVGVTLLVMASGAGSPAVSATLSPGRVALRAQF